MAEEKFTFTDLKEFDGHGKSGKIYVALGGKVYDVTKGGDKFYGPGKHRLIKVAMFVYFPFAIFHTHRYCKLHVLFFCKG